MTLQLQHVTKKYKDFTAVDNLNFTIEKGEILGLLVKMVRAKQRLFV